MSTEFDDLARAAGDNRRLLSHYILVQRRLQSELPPPPRRRRRFLPLLMVPVMLTLLLISAVTVGRARFVLAPCIGVTVNSGDDLQSLITANGTATTFCIQAGTNRITASGGLTPKTNDKFIGVGQNAIVDGSKLLTSWTVSGSNWFATGFLPGTAPSGGGTCASATPMCNQPNDIFRDGVWLSPVASQGALATGKAFVDYPNNRVYVRDDPNGHTVEQAWASRLFTGTATGVQIKNLTLQHAASITFYGAVDPGVGGTGWIIDHDEIRWNHGYGTGPGSASFGQTSNLTITASNVHHNGQDGTGGDGVGNTVRNNEVHHNSYAGYDVTWDGGNKFGHARNLLVDGNYYHDEIGPGIWCDIDCEDITVTNNYIERAQRGIMYEISCRASIHDNTVVDSSGPDPGGWGSISILISNSEGATVYNNHTYNGDRGVWAVNVDRTGTPTNCTSGGEHVVKNLDVHGNFMDLNPADPPFGGKTGLWTDTGRTDLYSTLNNHYQGNTYYDTTPSSEWDWGMPSPPYTPMISFAAFQAAGQDTTGSVVSSDPAAPSPPTLVVGPQP